MEAGVGGGLQRQENAETGSLALRGTHLNFAAVLPDDFLHDGLLAPVFAGVIWVLSSPTFPPAKLLSAPWLVVLGEASFGL